MASFVTEVLTATGTLGEKEDFPAKVAKIKKKLHDLKSCLQTHIESKSVNFATNVSDASSITVQMEELNNEIETINSNIKNHVKASLSENSKELLCLTEEIESLKLTSLLIEKIKSCYDAIGEGNEFIRVKQWLSASQTFSKSLGHIRSASTGLDDEEKVLVLPALKLELVRQQQKLMTEIGKQWKHNIRYSVTDDDCNVLSIDLETEKKSSLIQALYFSELLEDLLVKFIRDLKKYILEPVLSRCASLQLTPGVLKVFVGEANSGSQSPPLTVFTQLREIFSFISICLETSLSPVESGEEGEGATFMSLLCPHLSSWLCDRLVRDVLSPAVPTSPSQLTSYEEIIEGVGELHEYLVSTGVLKEQDKTILNYANNVDTICASKVCESLLAEGRDLMRLDLYQCEAVEPGLLGDTGIQATQEQLPVPPNFPLPHQSFQFPACKVSTSARLVLELAERGLAEAAQAKAITAVRLFHTVRQLYQLWCCVTPTAHAAALRTQPEVAALAHNSAMYIAHRLVFQGFSHRESLVEKVGQTTMVDLVPKVREVGCSMLLASLRLQRDHLKSLLQAAGFSSLARDRMLSSGAEQGVRGVLAHLAHLRSTWHGVLPSTVYTRCMATLTNTVLEELITIVAAMEDISAEAATQLVSLLSQVRAKTPSLFSPEPEDRLPKVVKRWNRFRELISVLGASLVEIEERWGAGSGPLAMEFQADLVKGLVRALFQNTERRAALLAKIK